MVDNKWSLFVLRSNMLIVSELSKNNENNIYLLPILKVRTCTGLCWVSLGRESDCFQTGIGSLYTLR